MRELISTEKKKAQAGNKLSNSVPKSSHAMKKPPPPRVTQDTLSFFSVRIASELISEAIFTLSGAMTGSERSRTAVDSLPKLGDYCPKDLCS